MRVRLLYFGIFFCLLAAGITTRSLAQTITTGVLTPGTVCQGATVSIAFTTTGTFSTTNVFSAQLSDATGAFSAASVIIGTTTTTGPIRATIPTAATGGTGYRIRVLASAPAVTGSTSAQTLTINVPALPAVSPPSAYCVSTTAGALVATPSAGGSLNWYGTNVSGGAASPTAPIPPTTTVGTLYYYVSQTINGCEGPRAAIPVIVKEPPAAPQTRPVGYCVGQMATPLSATGVSGAVLNWYESPTGGVGSVIAPTPQTTATGSKTYYVSQTANGCESQRTSLTVNVTTQTAAPTVTNPAPYCQYQPATALTATGDGLRWYGTNATGGVASTTATVPSTTSATTTTYYVTQTLNGCESPRTGITVTVKPGPSAPTALTAVSYCQGQSTTALQATAATGGTLIWYGTAPTGGNPSSTPPAVQTNQTGTTIYYVSQRLDGCESPRTGITVTVRSPPAPPNVPSSVATCQNRPVTMLNATPSAGGTLLWYGTAITGGTSSTIAPPISTSALGSSTYYVSQVVNSCESQRASVTVTTNAIPAPPTVTTSSNTSLCVGPAAQALSAVPAAGGTLLWYGQAATGGTGSSTPSTPATTDPASLTYYVAQIVNGCESDRAAIRVFVRATPSAPTVTSVEVCRGTQPTSFSATLAANAEANWYNNASGGTAQPIPPRLSSDNVGTSYYYVSQTLNGCESPRATATVRVKPIPEAPGVSPVSYCQNAPAGLLTASGNKLKWYDPFDAPLNDTPTPNTNSLNTQTFKVSQTSAEGCESPKATVTVTINPPPIAPGVSNLSYCQVQPDQPAQNVLPLQASGQNLRWYNPDGNAFTNTPIPAIDRAGQQVYQVSQTVNNCEGAKATLVVTVNTIPAPAVPRSLVAYCINDQAQPLQAVGEPGARLQWIDPYQRITTNAPTPATTNTNVQPEGDAFYVYQIGANGCYSPRSMIRVVVNATPTLALQAPTSTVNLGLKVPLQLKFTGSGPYSYTLTDGYSGMSRSSDTTISVLPRGNTTYQVVAVRNGCGAGLPGNPATALVSVRVPTITTSALTTSTLCAGTSLSVPFQTTGQFNPGNTFQFELASVGDTARKFTVQATANGSPVSGNLPATVPGGQYYVRVKANNPEVGIMGSNSPSLLTVRERPSAVLAGTQNLYEGVPANLTVTLGGDGPWTLTYADSVRTYTTTAATSPYLLEVRPTRTTAYRITAVSNGCGTGTVSGSATVTIIPLLAVADNPLDPLVKTYPVPTATVVTVELDLPLLREPAVLSVTDLRGRPVIEQTTRSQRNELDLSAQPNGLYLLQIRVGDRQTVRKIVKQ